MLCSIGHGEIPNLNFWFAPSCQYTGKTPLSNQILNKPGIYCTFNPFISSQILINPFLHKSTQIIVPKKGEIKIIESDNKEHVNNTIKTKEKNFKKLFEVSNCELAHDNISDSSIHDTHETHETHDSHESHETHDTSTHEHQIEFNIINENDITKFNTDQKLKKIHSTYHLKRKVSTKFQNQIKIHANNLIMECNKNNPHVKIPFLYPCTKAFREDVKIDTFKKIKNCTIEKYINEDIQCAGRSLNIKNVKIIELIKDITEKYEDNIYIKRLNEFLFKTIVIDYYNEFLESNNFKSCLEKDLQKYMEKLNSLGYSEDKIHLYKKIFKEKYEGIAKYLYYTD